MSYKNCYRVFLCYWRRQYLRMFWHKKWQGWQGSLSKLENCLSLHSFVEVSSVYCNTNLKFSHLIYAFENMLHLKLMKVRRDGSEIPVEKYEWVYGHFNSGIRNNYGWIKRMKCDFWYLLSPFLNAFTSHHM